MLEVSHEKTVTTKPSSTPARLHASSQRSSRDKMLATKPSRKLFDQAVSALPVPRSGIVFVGDSLRCDIAGAAGAGLATVWIDRARSGRRAGDPQPDFVVQDLLDLVRR